jgi:hypothetical protein
VYSAIKLDVTPEEGNNLPIREYSDSIKFSNCKTATESSHGTATTADGSEEQGSSTVEHP